MVFVVVVVVVAVVSGVVAVILIIDHLLIGRVAVEVPTAVGVV